MNLNQLSSNLPLSYLGYSLLLLLVCAAALVKVFRHWQLGRYPQGLRMIQGLTGLTILRLTTFLITYFAWRNNPGFTPFQLILDQIAALIGVVIIFWLWSFPEPSREGDSAVLVLIILIGGYFVVQSTILPNMQEIFTGTLIFWKAISLTFLVIGSGLVIIRKPNFWIYGLFMGVILGLGTILSIFSPETEILHLSQLTAYPLLLLLGERFQTRDSQLDEDSARPFDQERQKVRVEYRDLELIQKLFDGQDPTGILYKIAETTAYLILADLALLIDTPDEHGKIRIIAGFDLIREESLPALTLDSRSVPLLSNYIQRGKVLHIPASSTSRDLSHLSKMLQLSKPGHLLAAPVHITSANKTIGVVLFSPFSNRPWTKDDQNYIQLLTKVFEAAFNQHLVSQDGESEQVKQTIRDLTTQLTEITTDKTSLKEEIAVLSKDHQNLLLDHDVLRTKYDQLQIRSNSLQRHLAMLVDLSNKESTEALRKYISVIDAEVEKEVELEIAAKSEKEGPSKPRVKSTPEEVDPDSTRPANLLEAIETCLENVKEDINQKNLTTVLDLPDDTSLLKMNHALFKEIISFLIDNAIEENDQDGEINIRTQIYQEDQSRHFAHIKISDQGDGYFPDEIAAVLNNNLTIEQQKKLNQVMTNLYVTKNLVENEGGRMWVESKPGGGTTVSLLLAFL
jgi:signal transduction histidine kinase